MAIASRKRVELALRHVQPDRTPVDFLASPSVWENLIKVLGIQQVESKQQNDFFEISREEVLKKLQVDCRVLSYDMFCAPPIDQFEEKASVDWWGSLNRSTPNRMWRLRLPEGKLRDIWGIKTEIMDKGDSYYEGLSRPVLENAATINEIIEHLWPEPEWWDFQPIKKVISDLDRGQKKHLRFRIGSIFETAWQLRGLQTFLMEMVSDPEIPVYLLERITELCVANTQKVLELAGDRLDMLYFYDDVATQDSLLISPAMWKKFVYPYHAQLIEVADAYDKPVMYHCDGALYPLIPALIEMGVDVLNPIQPDAKGMEPEKLKEEFGEQITFHGGVSLKTLAEGTIEEVKAEVSRRTAVLGNGGGYILCSSHHIQHNTPVDNILAMYGDPQVRFLDSDPAKPD